MARPAQFFSVLHCILLTIVAVSAGAAEQSHPEWTVDNVGREALVFVPDTAKSTPTPVVFGFHGHGGSMNNAARSFRYHELWAERGETFAAVAPSGSAALKIESQLKSKPVFHAAGENDPLVRYQWQKLMIEYLKELNQCEAGQAWRIHAVSIQNRKPRVHTRHQPGAQISFGRSAVDREVL